MRELDATDQAYRNGYAAGYTRGVCDETARAMNGTIEWHEGIPPEDMSVCYICQPLGGELYAIRPAVYRKAHRCYYADDFAEDGSYVQTRLDEGRVRLWAKVRNPFSMKLSFEVKERDDAE